jgi:NifU-like protein involved in Fe-S cluster formation
MGRVAMNTPPYSPLVRRHFSGSEGVGRFEAGIPGVAQGCAGSREQGVAVQFQCRVEGERILEARFLAWGCPHSIAGASWLAEKLAGMGLAEAAGITGLEVSAALDVPADKLGSILILEDALGACLENARQRRYLTE